MSDKDYILQIKVRNGPMLRAMRASGCETGAQLARETGVILSTIYEYLGLKKTPLMTNGEWRASILQIADFLNTTPEALFPPQHLNEALENNRAEIEVSLAEIGQISGANPHDLMRLSDQRDFGKELTRIMGELTARERHVLESHLGFSGPELTLEEISQRLGVSRGRTQQIEAKALRKLRHPTRQPDRDYLRAFAS